VQRQAIVDSPLVSGVPPLYASADEQRRMIEHYAKANSAFHPSGVGK